MNFYKFAVLFSFLIGLIVPAFADVQNIQVFENQKPISVEASNPVILSVSPNSFVYGTLDTSSYPQVVCQLEDCLWQVDSQGYTGYHIRFSGIEPNNTAIVKVSDFGFVFEPRFVEKQASQDPSIVAEVQYVPYWVFGAIGVVSVGVIFYAKTRQTGVKII